MEERKLQLVDSLLRSSSLRILNEKTEYEYEEFPRERNKCCRYTIECVPGVLNLVLKLCVDSFGYYSFAFSDNNGEKFAKPSSTTEARYVVLDAEKFVESKRQITMYWTKTTEANNDMEYTEDSIESTRQNTSNPTTEMLKLLERLITMATAAEDSSEATLHSILQLLKDLMRILAKKNGGGTEKDPYSLESVLNGEIPDEVELINNVLEVYRDVDLLKSDTYPYTFWSSYVRVASAAVKKRIKNTLKNQLRPFTVGEINELYTVQTKMSPKIGVSKFAIVIGVDAKLLPASKLAENAVLQVASQFNFLESKTPEYTEITKYTEDLTQGPQASIGSLAALILRDAKFKNKDPQTIFDRNKAAGMYKGGYLMPYWLEEQKQADLLAHLNTEISSLRILAQWGLPEVGDGAKLLQVFTAAPSFQEDEGEDKEYRIIRRPDEGSLEEQMCTLLVTSQYRAIAQIAALRSIFAKTRVPLHLTLVGQGAFNNPACVMRNALKAVYDSVKGFDVDVFIHLFSMDKDLRNLRPCIPDELNFLKTKTNRDETGQNLLIPDSYWTKDEFMSGEKKAHNS